MIWTWQTKAQVESVFPNGAELRLTLTATSGYELGLYQAYMREARDYIKKTHGVDAVEFLKDDSPERLAEWGQYHQRAIMLSTLAKVETRENAESDWQTDQLPEEWRAIATFAHVVPGALFDEWVSTALELNPGQFLTGSDDTEKKGVRVSVKMLLN